MEKLDYIKKTKHPPPITASSYDSKEEDFPVHIMITRLSEICYFLPKKRHLEEKLESVL